MIDDQFRIIFDLQGYSQNDIPDSFLFDHSISFHMTEQNIEEFEGFEDIWSAILDERVLIKLTDKIEALRQKYAEEMKPKPKNVEQSEQVSESEISENKDQTGEHE